MSDSSALLKGIILKGIGGFYYVETADGFSEEGRPKVYECRARGLFRKEKLKPLAGDIVTIQTEDDESGTVVEIHERKNALKRPPVANLDYLMIVASVAAPTANTLLIDKLTAFAEHKQIKPVVLISKADLGQEKAGELAEIYKKINLPVFVLSSEIPDELEELKNFFQPEKIYAFAGNSGTGKSSLLNRLDPSLSLETGEISDKLGRGRHTTRQVELFHFLSGFLIDTPGFSSFEPDRSDVIFKDELADCFAEFSEYIESCKFVGCAHMGDLGCAVCKAVEDGEIPKSRYRSYETMYNEVKDIQSWEV